MHGWTPHTDTPPPRAVSAAWLAIALMTLLLACILPAPYADTSPILSSVTGWFPIIHTASNAYFMWQAPWPLVALIPTESPQAWCFALLMLLGIGSAVLVFVRRPKSGLLPPVIGAMLAPSTIWLLFGCDVVLLGAVAWIPWVAAASFAHPHRARMLLSALSGILLLLSAWQLSILALWGAYLLGDTSRLGLLPGERRVWTTLTILAIMLALGAPLPPFPQYPRFAHLVPDDGLPGIIRPLFGPELPLPILERLTLPYALAPFAWGLALTFLALRRFVVGPARALWTTATVAFLLVALDCWPLSEGITSIMPLQSVARIVPGLFLFPLAPFVLAFGVFATIHFGFHCRAFVAPLVWLLLITPAITAHRAGAFMPEGIDTMVRQALSLQDPQLTELAVSPSHYALRALGWANVKLRSASMLVKHRIDSYASTVESSHPAELAALADHNRQTRWSPNSASQTGNEWLRITFDAPQSIRGFILVTGPFASDFPRGLRVRYGNDCREFPERLSGPQIAFEQRSWQGRIDLTSSGYPFFSGQENVDLLFPHDIESDCFLIEQTGRAPFDWSVVELLVWESEEKS